MSLGTCPGVSPPTTCTTFSASLAPSDRLDCTSFLAEQRGREGGPAPLSACVVHGTHISLETPHTHTHTHTLSLSLSLFHTENNHSRHTYILSLSLWNIHMSFETSQGTHTYVHSNLDACALTRAHCTAWARSFPCDSGVGVGPTGGSLPTRIPVGLRLWCLRTFSTHRLQWSTCMASMWQKGECLGPVYRCVCKSVQRFSPLFCHAVYICALNDCHLQVLGGALLPTQEDAAANGVEETTGGVGCSARKVQLGQQGLIRPPFFSSASACFWVQIFLLLSLSLCYSFFP